MISTKYVYSCTNYFLISIYIFRIFLNFTNIIIVITELFYRNLSLVEFKDYEIDIS